VLGVATLLVVEYHLYVDTEALSGIVYILANDNVVCLGAMYVPLLATA
jgi:hypothetical protein